MPKIPKLVYLDADMWVFIKERCLALTSRSGEVVSPSEWFRRLIRLQMKAKTPPVTHLPDEEEEVPS